MFFIPGFLIALVTFPGVIVHEMAHQLFCKWQHVAVFNVCYFRLGNPAGYVIHEIPRRTSQSILIGIGPFIVNSLLGALIAFPAAIPVMKFGSADPLDYFLVWLGISIAMHAFPSIGDAKSIWAAGSGDGVSIVTKIIAFPIVGLIYIGAFGSMVWLDAGYGFVVAMLLPNALMSLLA